MRKKKLIQLSPGGWVDPDLIVMIGLLRTETELPKVIVGLQSSNGTFTNSIYVRCADVESAVSLADRIGKLTNLYTQK